MRTLLIPIAFVLLALANQYLADGRTIAPDEQGNSLGGVRSTYLDVPLARHVVVSTQNATWYACMEMKPVIASVLRRPPTRWCRRAGICKRMRRRSRQRAATTFAGERVD